MTSRMASQWARASVVAVLLMLTGSCSADRDVDPGGSESTSASHSAGPDNPPPEVKYREAKKLATDQPGGPTYRTAIPAEPTKDQLQTAARATATRADAERFAIILHHALQDQTSDSVQDSARQYLSPDLPDASRDYLDGLSLSLWKDTRIVPGSRSWLRSKEVSTSDQGPVVQVQLVEQIECPGLGNGPGDPFVYWGSYLITLVATAGDWVLTDIQSTGGSEYETFSPYTWKEDMDSGKGWRRFDVG